jgi:hypothetical protein
MAASEQFVAATNASLAHAISAEVLGFAPSMNVRMSEP